MRLLGMPASVCGRLCMCHMVQWLTKQETSILAERLLGCLLPMFMAGLALVKWTSTSERAWDTSEPAFWPCISSEGDLRSYKLKNAPKLFLQNLCQTSLNEL